MATETTDSARARTVNGTHLVILMFLMGITATGLLFTYWNLHLMRFMPLQEAIVAVYPDSAPRVDGGQRKKHQDTPALLRIVLRIPFDPTEQSEATTTSLNDYMTELRELSKQHLDIDEYQFLEVHFYHPVKEKDLREWMIRRDFQSWQDVDATGQPLEANSTLEGDG